MRFAEIFKTELFSKYGQKVVCYINEIYEIMNILKDLHKDGRTVILITHDDEIAAQVHRVIRIKDGKVEADFYNEEAKGGHEDDFKEV